MSTEYKTARVYRVIYRWLKHTCGKRAGEYILESACMWGLNVGSRKLRAMAQAMVTK